MTFWGLDLIHIFQKGSFAMWPLLLCSVIGTAVILERSFYFLRIRLNYKRFRENLLNFLRRGEIREARKFSRKFANPIPRIADQYLINLTYDDLRQDILSREGSLALEKLETRLRVLATITHIAPLIGLLGTVTGLVTAFNQIEILGGQVQPSDLAGGIWEALLTTVFGLIVSIPCMVAYHVFESLADKTARKMKFMITELDEFFGKLTEESEIKLSENSSQEDVVKSIQ